MRRNRSIVLLSFLLFLLSCTHVQDEQPVVFPSETPTPIVIFPTSTNSPFPTSTCTLTPEATVTETPYTATNTPFPVFEICSPLAEQTLHEISEIVSDPYNPPPLGKDDRHQGTDLSYYRRKDRSTIEGEEVQSLFVGRVVAVVKDQLPYGNMVIIETVIDDLLPEINQKFEISEDESLYVLYAHFKFPPVVRLGEMVGCGQTLGEVGATGYNIVNPHLHIETRIGKSGHTFMDGMAYYDTRNNEKERSNYVLWRMSGEFRHFDPMFLINAYLSNSVGE